MLRKILIVFALLIMCTSCGSNKNETTEQDKNTDISPTPAAEKMITVTEQQEQPNKAQETVKQEETVPREQSVPKTETAQGVETAAEKPALIENAREEKSQDSTKNEQTKLKAEPVDSNQQVPAASETEKTDTVSIKIIGLNDRVILEKTDAKFVDGQTVYDLLKAVAEEAGIEIKVRGSGSFAYVAGINGLSEFDEGPLSGWLYYVNGNHSTKSAGAYKLSKGDQVVWKYTLDGRN